MRRYDDPVEVRRGMVGQGDRQVEAPEQFLWRGTLWKVREVVAHWVETGPWRSEEHTSELQSLMRISYAVFCLKKKKHKSIRGKGQNTHSSPVMKEPNPSAHECSHI